MKMLLTVFLAFCFSGFAASSPVNEIQTAVFSEPDFVGETECGCSIDPVPQCGCCVDFEIIGKEHMLCMNMMYVEEEKGLRFTVVLNGLVLFNKTYAAKDPLAICAGTCPISCICVNYYNMSYGDDDKWGGCLEIYVDSARRVLDIKLGCHYFSASQTEQKTIDKPIQSLLFNEMQQRFRNTYGKRMSDHLQKKKNPLDFFFKNRVEEDNEESKGLVFY